MNRSPFDVTGRIALVTGGSAGLGAAAARTLAAAGARVALAARDPERLEASAASLRVEGAEVMSVPLDVTDSDSTHRAVERVMRELGGLHILVNAAGTIVRGSILEATAADFDEVMRTNAFGTWNLCRAASRYMQAGGAIVNVISTAGLIGMSDRSAYAASKGAAMMITRSLAVELAPRGIRVNAVAPGPFATDLSSASQSTERWKKLIAERVPLKRVATAGEIGPPILFLASDASSFITGVVLPVDGGWTAS